jgi:4-amino-4-deoxy-L-arabinose transferase-like glycosyltransferase
VARNILDGRWFVVGDDEPAFFYPPGFSCLLAGVFGLSDLLNVHEGTMVQVFILLCTGLASVLVFYIARTVWGSLPALVSSLVWITHPFILWLTKQPNSEIPFIPLLYGGFYLFWQAVHRGNHSWHIFFFSGVLAGLAMLVRSIALGAGVVMVVLIWLAGCKMTARLRLLLSMMVLLGNLVAVLPWEAWVYAQTGTVVLLSTVGQDSLADGLTFTAFPEGYRQIVPHDVSTLLRDFEARYGEMHSLRNIISLLVEELRERPLAVAQLFALKAARSWYGTNSGRFEALLILVQIPYLALVLWGSYAAWRQGGIAKQLTISTWLIALYFWGMSVLGIAMLRYMVPAIGLLVVLVPGIRPRLSTYSRFKVGEKCDNQHSRHFGFLS